jgi:hypothetical protein
MTTKTKIGKRLVCGNCGATYMVTKPGENPSCCGKPLDPK